MCHLLYTLEIRNIVNPHSSLSKIKVLILSFISFNAVVVVVDKSAKKLPLFPTLSLVMLHYFFKIVLDWKE